MKRMTRMASKKSHSWWWDSHVSPKNSKWLEDNLIEMDCCVKEMLKLIEEEGDSFAKKAEMYYKRRPELIAHVEDIYRMYRALAERYDNVTGELRRNIPSELHSQGSGSGSDLGSEPASPSLLPSPELTPERKPPRPKPGPRAAGFDFFLGSGGSSDHSRKGSDGSSSCSESDSDSDDSKDANADNASSILHQRILVLENELLDVKEKLHKYEGNDSHNRCRHPENTDHVDCTSSISALEKDLMASDEKLHFAEDEISTLMQKLAEKNSSFEAGCVDLKAGCVDLNLKNKQAPELEEPITVMETEISQYKQENEYLKVALMSANQRLSANISDRKMAIEECKAELSSLTKSYLLDKSRFETELMDQQHTISEFQSNASCSLKQLLQYKCTIEDLVYGFSHSCASLEAKVISLEDIIKLLEAEMTRLCAQYGKHTDELNRNIDVLKLNIDMLTSEKEELGAKVSRLIIEVKCRDGRISEMNEHLQQLHLEHVKLIIGIEEAREVREELQSRVKELEEEVNRQRVAVLDGAEGKREAIRQLCFSLDHYRDGYYQLRQVLQALKQTTVL